MSHTIKMARSSRITAERIADQDRRREAMAAFNVERGKRGLGPWAPVPKRAPFVDRYRAPVQAVVFAPVLPGSRLVDADALLTFGTSEAAATVFEEHARFFFCRKWIEGTEYSVSAAGLHVRADLWPEIGRRLASAEQGSRARIERVGRAGKRTTPAVF